MAAADPHVRVALRGAWVAGIAAATALTNGCASPECQPTRMGEVATHLDLAVSDLAHLQPGAAWEEVKVGLGLVPHASNAVAGMIPVVEPILGPIPVGNGAPAPDDAEPETEAPPE